MAACVNMKLVKFSILQIYVLSTSSLQDTRDWQTGEGFHPGECAQHRVGDPGLLRGLIEHC